MDIINIIDALYINKIDCITKHNLFILIKNVLKSNNKSFTYYKINLLLIKLIETKVLIKYMNKYKFNKSVKKINNSVYFN